MERDQKSFPTYTPRKLVKANKHVLVEETYIFIYFSTASFSAQLALACIYAIEKSAFEERFMGHPAFFLTATEDRFCFNAHGAVGERPEGPNTLTRAAEAGCLLVVYSTTFISFLHFML